MKNQITKRMKKPNTLSTFMMTALIALTIGFVTAASVNAQCDTASFAPAVNYDAVYQPASAMTGDFNGDGILDLAVANRNSDNISVLLSNGNGTFQQKQDLVAGNSPSSVTTGDFNGDGILDLATANFNGTVSVLLGNGNGTFQHKQDFAVDGFGGFSSITTGDLNSDGSLDLVTTGLNNYDVSVLLNTCPAPVQNDPPTTKEQCKNNDWMNFTVPRAFRNQGDCIQFVNTGR